MDEVMHEKKRELLERLLEKGMVMVVLDARRPGVAVPPHLAEDPQLRLNLSWRFGSPMELDGWGVKAILTFGGSPFACRLPWNSIGAMVSHASKDEQYVFPDALPDELQRLVAGEPDVGDEEEAAELTTWPGEAPASRRFHLALVEGGAPAEGEAENLAQSPESAGGDEEPPKPSGRPSLRLIK